MQQDGKTESPGHKRDMEVLTVFQESIVSKLFKTHSTLVAKAQAHRIIVTRLFFKVRKPMGYDDNIHNSACNEMLFRADEHMSR